MKNKIILLLITFCFLASPAAQNQLFAQNQRCDPGKVVAAESCAKCHAQAVQTWKRTPHFQTFEKLHRDPRAKEICGKLGLSGSIKRNEVCKDCHYTTQKQGDRLRVVSGISCESCHGAALDWVNIHSDYGGPTASQQSETASHRQSRLDRSIKAGMRNPKNIYSIARSCLNCHTVPNEKLVNVGGHKAGSDFELVSWSQGMVRHNFLRTGSNENAKNSQSSLRVMFVVGLIADLEFSTRATSQATSRNRFGLSSAGRAASVAVKLYQIQQQVKNSQLQAILEAFARAELCSNNQAQLEQIADTIRQHGLNFAETCDGSTLLPVDKLIPPPSQYR